MNRKRQVQVPPVHVPLQQSPFARHARPAFRQVQVPPMQSMKPQHSLPIVQLAPASRQQLTPSDRPERQVRPVQQEGLPPGMQVMPWSMHIIIIPEHMGIERKFQSAPEQVPSVEPVVPPGRHRPMPPELHHPQSEGLLKSSRQSSQAAFIEQPVMGAMHRDGAHAHSAQLPVLGPDALPRAQLFVLAHQPQFAVKSVVMHAEQPEPVSPGHVSVLVLQSAAAPNSQPESQLPLLGPAAVPSAQLFDAPHQPQFPPGAAVQEPHVVWTQPSGGGTHLPSVH